MSIQKLLLTCLLGLVALAGVAAAQEAGPCPECDEDGEPDDSWYNSVDTGIITEEGGVVEDTDMSTGENQHGKFTWFQYCLRFFDALGNEIALMYEVFVSEDGADIDAKLDVNGEEIDLEDTLVGDLDDKTWGNMPETGLDVPVPYDELPEGQDVDECVYVDDTVEVAAEATASCEIAIS